MQRNLSETIATDIRNKILDRTYPPNCRIPSEFELAQQYDVCRYTIREAIKKLVAVGLVTVERGKGTFVNEAAISSYIEPMIERLVLIDRDVNEIFEARLAIEMKTVSLASQYAVPDEIDQMRAIIKKMNEALENGNTKLYNQLDLELHKNIALAGKNRILIEILSILFDMISYAMERVPASVKKYEHSTKGHECILNAIEQKDANLAEREMFDHLNFCRQLATST